MERRNAWLSYTEAEEKELEQVAKAYRNFLNVGKTERECVTQIIREARAAGYESLEEKTAKGEKLKAGDKIYTVGMKKIIALFHIGQDDISEGMNILGAHIDSPLYLHKIPGFPQKLNLQETGIFVLEIYLLYKKFLESKKIYILNLISYFIYKCHV